MTLFKSHPEISGWLLKLFFMNYKKIVPIHRDYFFGSNILNTELLLI